MAVKTLKMEAGFCSETQVGTYKTTRYHNSETRNLKIKVLRAVK
jgi:hypothetical protein